MKKVLFAATVVKTHIMEFHIPFLRMFQQAGWETAVAARNDYEDPGDCVIPCCDRYYDIPFERSPLKPGNLRAYRDLKRVIDEGEYDLIHCHTPVGALLTRLAARKARKKRTKVIYTAHGFHFYRGAPMLNWLVYFPAEWLCGFFTDVLITINREDYAFAQKHIHAGNVCYVPGVGVDLTQFHSSREAAREKLGIGKDEFVLLSVGEMTVNKNHRLALQALALLRRKPIRYVLVGRGEQMEALKAQARELGISDRVIFTGYRNDVAELYPAADAFFFPSIREGLSVALMEAMASGLPAIVGQIRGNTDLIDDGVEGLYMPLTPEGAAEAIQKLYDDPELRSRLGEAAREKVRRFSAPEVQRKMREIYRDTLGAGDWGL